MATPVTQLIVLLVAGVLAARAGGKLKIPEVIPLLVTGYLLGPDLLGLWQPAVLGIDLQTLALVAVPVILFYDGLKTDAANLTELWKTVVSVSTVAVLVTFAGIASVSHFFLHLSWVPSLLLGAILSSSDPAAVISVLKKVNIRRRLSTLMEAETALNDATATTLFIIVLALATGGTLSIREGLSQFIYATAFSFVIGVLVGLTANEMFRRLKLQQDITFASFVVILAAYGLAEAVGVSSLMAVMIAAIVFRYFLQSPHVDPLHRIHTLSLWENLNFLAIAMIFLVLGGEVQIAAILPYVGVGLVISLAFIFIVRPLTILVSTAFDNSFTLKEKLFIAWVGAPRGSVSAALASIVLAKAAAGSVNPVEAQAIFGITLVFIFTTIIIASLTARMAARRLLGASEESVEMKYRELATELKSMMVAGRRMREEWKTGLIPTSTYDQIDSAHKKQMQKIEAELLELSKTAPDIENKARAAYVQSLLMNQVSALQAAFENRELPEDAYERLLQKFHSQVTRLTELEERAPLQPKTGEQKPVEKDGGKKP